MLLTLNGCQAETVVGLPWAAGSCPWVGKLQAEGDERTEETRKHQKT
jgi:hypothetical protein